MQLKQIKEWHTPTISVTITNNDWSPMDLTDYDAVDFVMVNSENTAVINTAWEFSWDKTEWIVKYAFQTWETNNIWDYVAYFTLKLAWAKIFAAPVDNFEIKILESFT